MRRVAYPLLGRVRVCVSSERVFVLLQLAAPPGGQGRRARLTFVLVGSLCTGGCVDEAQRMG